MNRTEFQKIVPAAAVALAAAGFQAREEPGYTVELWKALLPGVYCLVAFDWYLTSLLPYAFHILLIRRHVKAFSGAETLYQPLYIDLPNLMVGLHQKDIFPLGEHAWKFVDEESLRQQVTEAEKFVVDYGLKWLEDPRSNVDWVKRGRANTGQP